eukprot:4642258-Pleurochrysis_carterae.AAC.1
MTRTGTCSLDPWKTTPPMCAYSTASSSSFRCGVAESPNTFRTFHRLNTRELFSVLTVKCAEVY